MPSDLTGPWVCSICGSSRIEPSSIQASLGDPKHPLGLCWECRGTQGVGLKADGTPLAPNRKPLPHPLSPLCHPIEYRPKSKPLPPAAPEDLFGALPEADRAALARPLR